ncbi:MAG: RHS repeat-associated core domain-containing protein [Polyangiales bacterium]
MIRRTRSSLGLLVVVAATLIHCGDGHLPADEAPKATEARLGPGFALAVTAVTQNSVTLTATVAGYTAFNVYSVSSAGVATLLTGLAQTAGTDPVGGPTVSWVVPGLTPCTTSKFRVDALFNGYPYATATASASTAGSHTGTPPALPPYASDFVTVNQYLWSGTSFQSGGTTAIDPASVGVVRGRVRGPDGSPMACVTVQAIQPAQFGSVVTDATGTYSIAVNAAASTVLKYSYGDGVYGSPIAYMPVQRTLTSHAHDYAHVDDVWLTTREATPLVVPIGGTTATLAEQPTPSANESGVGTRTLVAAFPPGVGFTVGGTALPGSSVNLRIREYTVGANGASSMPGTLPPSTAYTYAVNLSLDGYEGQRVNLTKPVDLFVASQGTPGKSFLNFPVGTAIPVGYYDEQLGQWTANEGGSGGGSGCVVAFDGTVGSLACPSLSLTPPDSTVVTALRAKYSASSSTPALLWRVQVSHFTSFDFNVGLGAALGALFPSLFGADANNTAKPACANGSIIQCENQVVGERFPLGNSGLQLVYNSDRHPGRIRQISAAVDTNPPSGPLPKRIVATALVAGRELDPPVVSTSGTRTRFDFTWDGRDPGGRVLLGRQEAHVRIGYVYPGSYTGTGTWAAVPGYSSASTLASADASRFEVTLWRDVTVYVDSWDDGINGFGGLAIDAVHFYDSGSQTIFRGDGSSEYAETAFGPIVTIAGGVAPNFGTIGHDFAPLAVAASRSLTGFIGADGVWTLANGSSVPVLVSNTQVDQAAVFGAVAFGPAGELYSAGDAAIVRRRTFGTSPSVQSVVGCGPANGTTCIACSPGVAGRPGCEGSGPAATSFANIQDLVVADDGWLYFYGGITGSKASQVWRWNTVTNALERFAGVAVQGDPAVGPTVVGPSRSLDFTGYYPSIAVTPDGMLYVQSSDSTISQIRTADAINLGDAGTVGPGIMSIAGARDGTLLIARRDYADGRFGIARLIPRSGLSAAFVVSGTPGSFADGGADVAAISIPLAVAVAPDGSILFVDNNQGNLPNVRAIRKSQHLLAGGVVQNADGSTWVASKRGDEKYLFDAQGRHLQTVDTTTGNLLYSFARTDSANPQFVTQVSNADGPLATLLKSGSLQHVGERGAYGTYIIESISAPNTLIDMYDPAANHNQLTLDPNGLLLTYRDSAATTSPPHGNPHTYLYDTFGRLARDTEPSGQFKALGFVRLDDPTGAGVGWEVDVQTALNRIVKHRVQSAPDGTVTRTFIDAAGLVTAESASSDGTTSTNVGPSGLATRLLMAPDTRYGSVAPYVSQSMTGTLTPPAGSSVVCASAPAACTISSTLDPVTMTQAGSEGTLSSVVMRGSDVATIAASFPSFGGPAGGTISATTPGGRHGVMWINQQNHVVRVDGDGLDSQFGSYDSNGRLVMAWAGSGCGALAVPSFSCATPPVAAVPVNCRRTLFGYGDAAQGPTCVIDSLNNVTRVDRDALGRPTAVHPPTANTWGGTGAVSNSVQFTYTHQGDLTITVPYQYSSSVQAHGFTTNFADLADLYPESYTPPALTMFTGTTTTFDLDGNFKSIGRPQGFQLQALYQAGGAVPNSGRVASLDDYVLGLGSGASAGGSTFGKLSVTYDAAGSGAGLNHTDSTGTFVDSRSLSFDYVHRLETSNVAWAAPTGISGATTSASVSLALDSRLRLTSQSISIGGVAAGATSFGYDSDNLMTSVVMGSVTAQFSRMSGFADARITAVSLGSSASTETHRYNEFGELASVSGLTSVSTSNAALGAPGYLEAIERDQLGRVTRKVETVIAASPATGSTNHVTTYSYYPLGWLASSTIDGVLTAFQYDENGNRLLGAAGGVCDVDAQDRLGCYNYDANGAQTNDTGSSLGYDGFGHLSSYTFLHCTLSGCTPNGGVTYVNDVRGRRLMRQLWPFSGGHPSSWTTLVYDDDALLPIATVDSTPAGPSADVVSRYVYGPATVAPFAIERGGVVYRIVVDHVGSVRAVINATTGTVEESRIYDAWGNLTSHSEAAGWSPIVFGFAGGLEDRTTHIVKFGSREYEPAEGRWLSKDPLRFAGGSSSLYTYAFNDPVNYVDPRGSTPLVTAVIGAGIGSFAMTAGGYAAGDRGSNLLRDAAVGAAGGFVSGATMGFGGAWLGGLVDGGALGGAFANGIASALGNLASQLTYNAITGCSGINWVNTGVAGLVGAGVGAALFRPAVSSVQTVTSWAAAGKVPDLGAGRWVMLGSPSPSNFLGTIGPAMIGGVPYTNFATGVVAGAQLAYPTGLAGNLAGIIGQRIILP